MKPEIYEEMAFLQDHHWWFVARRQVLAAVIEELHLSPGAEILEIGCGTGGNLRMLGRFGRLQAIECDDYARAIANALGLCPVLAGGLPDDLPVKEHSFDLICLLDVLEHIEDDGQALVQLRRLLKPTGRLLLTMPAYSWLWSTHDEAHHHFRRYTSGIIRRRAAEAALTVSRLGYFNSILFLLIAGIRAFRKIGYGSECSDTAMPSRPLNLLLAKIFGLERHIVRYMLFPFGTSVLAVLCPTNAE